MNSTGNWDFPFPTKGSNFIYEEIIEVAVNMFDPVIC